MKDRICGIRKRRYSPGMIVSIVIMSIASLLIILPLIYVVAVSLTSEQGIVENGYRLFPKEISLDAYKQVFVVPKTILRAYGVTIFVTFVGTAMSMMLTSTLAYVCSRRDFRYRKFYSVFTLLPLLFNGGMVACYIVNTQIFHLSNSIWALILPYGVNVWYVFMMKGFYASLPFELIESAKIDGAGELRTFFQIIMPLSKAAFATIALFYVFSFWNDWWLAMLYIRDNHLMPLQQLLQKIMANVEFYTKTLNAGVTISGGKSAPMESMRMALAVVAAGPMLVVFPFFQKYFVKGVTVGSVKG